MLDTRGLVKLGRMSVENLDISSQWIRLDAKVYVSVIMDLVAYMDTDAKWEMRPNALGMPFTFLSIS